MKNETGRKGEDAATAFLQKSGYKVVKRNFNTRFGEIDVIAENSEFLVFCEVRTRALNSMVSPAESINSDKIRRLKLSAEIYLSSRPTKKQPRFDVVEVVHSCGVFSVKNHIQNAF